MKKLFSIFMTLFIIYTFSLNEVALSWEGDPTHRDITEYAAENSVLSKGGGNYLKNIGFSEGVKERLTWNSTTGKKPTQTILEWLQEGSALEDAGNFWQVITCKGRFMNHFHNPLKNKNGGTWGEWNSAGLDDYLFDPISLYHLTGHSSLLWAQNGDEQSSWPGGDWSWKEARDRYYLALTSKTDAERQENFARTFRGLGHQLHIIQDKAVPAHVRNDAHPWKHNHVGGILLEPWAIREENRALIISFASKPLEPSDFPTVNLNKAIIYKGETLVPIAQLIDTDEYNGSNPSTSLSIGLAEYTNANFFSDDTIFTEDYPIKDRHYFPYPKKSDTNLQRLIDQDLLPETNRVCGTFLNLMNYYVNEKGVFKEEIILCRGKRDLTHPELYIM